MAAHFTFQMATFSPILIAFLVRGTLSTSKIGVQNPPIEVLPAEETQEAPALDRIEYDHADKNRSNVYYVQVSGSSVNGSVHNQVIIIDKFVGNLGESSEESVEQMTNVDDHSNGTDSKPDGSSNSTTSITTHGTNDGDKGGSYSTGYSNGSTTEIPIEDFAFSVNQSSNANATEGQVKDYQPTTNNYHEATADSHSSLKDLTISTDAADGALTDIEQETPQDTSNLFSTTTKMMPAETHDSTNTDLNSSTESHKYIVEEEIAQPIGDFDVLATQIPSEESPSGGEQTEGHSSTTHASSSYDETTAMIPAEEAPSSYSDSLTSNTDPTSFGEQGDPQATTGLDGPTTLVPMETPPSSSNQSSKTENRTNGGQNYVENATTQSTNYSEGIIILVPGETPVTFSDRTPYTTVEIGEYLFTTESPMHAQPPETTTYDDQSTTQVAVDFDRSTAVVPEETSHFVSIGGHNYEEEDMGDLNGPSISLASQTSSSSNDVTSYRANGTGADQTAEQLTTQSTDYSYRASSVESGETQSHSNSTPIHITERPDEGPTYEQHFTTETSRESLEETSSFSIDPSSSVPTAAPVLPETPLVLNPPIFSGVQTTPKAPVTYHPPHITVFRPLQASVPGIPHLPGNYPYAGSLRPGQRYVPPWIQHSLPAYTNYQHDRRYFVQPYNPFWRTAQNNASEERTRTHLE